QYFEVDLERLDAAAELVVAEIQRNYPDGNVPFHSRWRHFEVGGHDLWRDLISRRAFLSPTAMARARIDLAVLSVLLDAGAGAGWMYRDAATGLTLGRSEGLALASLRLFESGALSVDPDRDPLR